MAMRGGRVRITRRITVSEFWVNFDCTFIDISKLYQFKFHIVHSVSYAVAGVFGIKSNVFSDFDKYLPESETKFLITVN